MVQIISRTQARRLALIGQGLGADRCASANDVVGRLGALQLDGLQTVELAHRLTLHARITDAPLAAFDAELWPSPDAAAQVFDAPAHAACVVPLSSWPSWEPKREAERRRRGGTFSPAQRRTLVETIHAQGPQTLAELQKASTVGTTKGWDWSPTKRLVEHMVRTGELVVCRRRGRLRVIDVPEAEIPARLRDCAMTSTEATSELVAVALRASGVATVADLGEYFRLPTSMVQQVVDTVEGSTMVEVEGWPGPAFATNDHLEQLQAWQDDVHAPALIGPFDNLIWNRRRIERLFGFKYSFEAYMPAAKREYGAYVMAVLAGDRIVARIDLRRDGRQLVVRQVFPEPSGGSHARQLADEAVGQLQQQLSRKVDR